MTQREQNTLASLADMLTYARPHCTKTEAQFVTKFIDPLGVDYDKFGNAYKRIGDAPVLWSCHTDTVHHQEGRQKIAIEADIITLIGGKRGDCLGADDGAGVWLMSEMIRANVPGLYVFHAGEEHGCLGSKDIARNRPKFLTGIKAAIAFDRKGTRDVITHQMGERCCSESFALSLCKALNMKYRPDDSGTFTDTASYTDLIGECTNVSVGYECAHGPDENLNVRHLIKLRNRMVKFNVAALTFSREPGEFDYTPELPLYGGIEYDEALVAMVYRFPEAAARLIESLGGNAEDMQNAIETAGYTI